MKTEATLASQSSVERDATSLLADFDGNVQAAVQALEATSRRPAQKPVALSTTPVVVELTSVNRQYRLGRNRVAAVRDVNMAIHEGEIVAITGPSGSGKSTLLNLVGGLDRPDSGTVRVAGHDLAALSDRQLSQFRNRTVGFVFQFFYLQPFLTVRTNLEVPGMFARLARTVRAERAIELAAAVGLSDRLEHLPRELSGGQMQRAAIARALLNRPPVLLADEPTGNVDRANAHAIMELFGTLRHRYGTTIVIVTHDAEVAAQADRTIVIRDGQVQA